jgi:hypothetical protein
MSQLPRGGYPKAKKTVYRVFWFEEAKKTERTFELGTAPEFQNGFCSFKYGDQIFWLSGCIRVVRTEE